MRVLKDGGVLLGQFHASLIESRRLCPGVINSPFFNFDFETNILNIPMEYAGVRYSQMYGSMNVQQQSPREKAVMVRCH